MAFIQKKDMSYPAGALETGSPAYTVPSTGNVQNSLRLAMGPGVVVYTNAHDIDGSSAVAEFRGGSPAITLSKPTRPGGVVEGSTGYFGMQVAVWNEKIYVSDYQSDNYDTRWQNVSEGSPKDGAGMIYVYNFDGDCIDSIGFPYSLTYLGAVPDLNYRYFGRRMVVNDGLIIATSNSSLISSQIAVVVMDANTGEGVRWSAAEGFLGFDTSRGVEGSGSYITSQWQISDGRILRLDEWRDDYDDTMALFDLDGQLIDYKKVQDVPELLALTDLKFGSTPAFPDFSRSGNIGDGRIVILHTKNHGYNGAGVGPGPNNVLASLFDMDGNWLKYIYGDSDYGKYPMEYVNGYSTQSNVGIGYGRIVIGTRKHGNKTTNPGFLSIFDMEGNFLKGIPSPVDSAVHPNDSDGQFGCNIDVTENRILVGGYRYIYQYTLDGEFIQSETKSDNQWGESIAGGCGKLVAGDGTYAYVVDTPARHETVMDLLNKY